MFSQVQAETATTAIRTPPTRNGKTLASMSTQHVMARHGYAKDIGKKPY